MYRYMLELSTQTTESFMDTLRFKFRANSWDYLPGAWGNAHYHVNKPRPVYQQIGDNPNDANWRFATGELRRPFVCQIGGQQ